MEKICHHSRQENRKCLKQNRRNQSDLSTIVRKYKPRDISWCILLSEHRTRRNPTNRPKSNLHRTGNSTFARTDDIVLCKGNCSRLICIGTRNGKERPKEFNRRG